MEITRQHIKALLQDILPLVDLDSDFLFAELDSLGVTAILMTLSKEYGIDLEANDPKEPRLAVRVGSGEAQGERQRT